MQKLLPLLALLIIGASACNKSNDDGGGGSSPATYLPTTTGSTWNYRSVNLVTSATSNFTVTATAKDTTAASQTWRVFNNGSGSEYYRQSGSDYFQFGKLEGLGDPIELPLLKAGGAAGSTWTTMVPLTVSGITINVTATFTLLQKNTNHTVGATTFNNVDVVTVGLSVPPPISISSQNIRYYFAENVGRIESQVELVVPLAGINIKNNTTLQSYTIAP